MNEQAKTGMNRTGIQVSPLDASDMMDLVPPGDGGAPPNPGISSTRAQYNREADPLGSVPPPGTARGMLKTGVAAVMGEEPQLLMDKLGERLAFERTGTRLYDALIDKVEALQQHAPQVSVDQLRHIRDEEAAHFQMVAQAIESLGGDPTAQTPCADLAGVESAGLLKVVTDPRTSVVQSLHAILVGELTDNAGWEMLIALASEQGHDAMADDFGHALQHERQHLQQVRSWVEASILRQPMQMPPGAGMEAGPLH
ncbi:MAG: ferritin-like protein [Paucimonas sp.]|nr:ferritin-like protein [Paucimonas sp.]